MSATGTTIKSNPNQKHSYLTLFYTFSVLIAILILIPFLSLAHAAGTHESLGICPGTFKPHTAPPGPYHNHLIKRYRQRMVKSLEEHLTRLEATVEHSEWFRSLDATWPRHLQLPTFSVDLSMVSPEKSEKFHQIRF